jgi:ATP-dependent Clp protease protease subunit
MIENKKEKTHIPSLEENHYYLFNKNFEQSTTGDAMKFIIERNLMIIDRPKQIKMIINSYGGDLSSAFALIDTMKGSSIPIHTYGLGCIASCGLLTFIAGEKGKRFITRNTSILSHQFSWGAFGKEHELMASVKELDNVSKRMLDHYIKCTGLPEKDVKKYLLPSEDVWLTAKEAVKYGLADDICDFY